MPRSKRPLARNAAVASIHFGKVDRRNQLEHQASPYISLLLITVLAVVVPIALNRIRAIRIPIVVGEIVAGMIIGTSGLDLVRFTPTLEFLSEFGLAFLMFLSGLEVDIDSLAGTLPASSVSTLRSPVVLAGIYLAATIGLAAIFGIVLSAFGLVRSPILMALILSTTSLGVVVPILKERGLAPTQYGQYLLTGALVSDFVTLLLLSAVIAVLSRGFNIELLLSMLLMVAFFASVRISERLRRRKLVNRIVSELSHATAQIRVRGALALLVVFVVLAQSLGVELILGAFLAGLVVSISSRGTNSSLPLKLDAFGYGFFIPIFFITVGAGFDLKALTSSATALLLLPLLISASYVVKVVPAIVYRTMFSWKETLGLGILLSSRLSLIIAASAIALGIGLISSAVNSAVILVAIITCTLSPIVFQSLMGAPSSEERSGIAIFGTHQLAILLAQRLARTGEDIVFLSRFQDRLDSIRQLGYRTVGWDPTLESETDKLDLSSFRAFIAVSNYEDILTDVCRSAKEDHGIQTVIAKADDQDVARELREIGVGVVQPATAVALALESALLYPDAYNILLDTNDDVEVAEIPLDTDRFDRVKLSRIQVPGNALIVGIRRQGETVVPHGHTMVMRHDLLIIFGDMESLKKAREFFAG